MSAHENNVLDIKARQQDRKQTAKGYPFQTADEMHALPTVKEWLIKGVFARGESSGWIAPPGCLKSALMAEASICVAAGINWHGHRHKEQCGVVYFALERADLVRRRIIAHMTRLGLKGVPIVIVSEMVDPRNSEKIEDTIKAAAAELDVPVGLVIFDTFAKLIAAIGGDENSAQHQGMVFATLQRVKDATRVHVAIVGHTGKDEGKGWRGSNASLGDVDVMVTISGDGDIRTATVTKANDAPEGPLFSFKSEVHSFGVDEDGDPITVNVVSSEEVTGRAPKPNEPKLSPNQRVMFRLLHEAGAIGLTVEAWNDQARALDIGVTRKAALWELRGSLKDKGLAREYQGRWTVAHG
jgi:hypothetical protein